MGTLWTTAEYSLKANSEHQYTSVYAVDLPKDRVQHNRHSTLLLVCNQCGAAATSLSKHSYICTSKYKANGENLWTVSGMSRKVNFYLQPMQKS